MMTKYVFKNHHKFDKECSKLFKQCPSLEDDLEIFKEILIDDLLENGGYFPQNNTYFHVNRLRTELPVFKVKKFRCHSIKKGNRSGFRIIFIYDKLLSLIYFVQIYYKTSEKSEMDKKRAIKASKFIKNQ